MQKSGSRPKAAPQKQITLSLIMSEISTSGPKYGVRSTALRGPRSGRISLSGSSSPGSQLTYILNTDPSVVNETFNGVRTLSGLKISEGLVLGLGTGTETGSGLGLGL